MSNSSNSWKGVLYPISANNPHGYYAQGKGISQIKSDLLILLLTYPGERVMMESFGTPLKDLLFEPADSALLARARTMIIDSIAQWEPRVTIDQIEVSFGPSRSVLNPEDDYTENNSILLIQIQFRDPEILTEANELVLELPLN